MKRTCLLFAVLALFAFHGPAFSDNGGVWGPSDATPASVPAVAPAANGQFHPIKVIPWSDPLENAFSCEIPAGWKVNGGTIHRNAVDPRSTLNLESPDGLLFIRFGDASLPSYFLPVSPMFPEGSDYSPGYGVVGKVSRYIPGVQFARQYALGIAQGMGQDIKISSLRDRNDQAAAINANYGNLPMRSTCGEVGLTLVRKGVPYVGYCFATTQLTTVPGSPCGVWIASDLLICFAPVNREEEMRLVIAHVLASLRINPQWMAQNSKNAMQVSAIVTKTNQSISNMIVQGYEDRHRNDAALSAARQDATMGRERWVDHDGNTYIAPNTQDHFYRMPNGEVYSTSSSDLPAGASRIEVERKPVLDYR